MLPTRLIRHRLELLAVVAILLLASVFPVDLSPSAPHQLPGRDGQYSGKQGDVLLITAPVSDVYTSATGRFLNRQVPFFRNGSGYAGLLGLDMEDPPGAHELTVELKSEVQNRQLSYSILVIKQKYPVQHLTLPKDKVDLDETSLVRVKAEQEQVRSVLEAISSSRLWDGRFIEPVTGTSTGAFGRLRIINGQARSPHNGEDIAAPMGTDVIATADGIARLTVDHFFAGKGLFLDHGLGLFSMYFHLSEILVQDGQRVTKGQVIGKVGASGRASGPHLHWAVRINGARVNPYSLLKLTLDPTGAHS
jgi:murein DD-endopeptidase MepM/ murein hydrolase activator NlpD